MLLASYPRSGSTWLRFLLYELLSGQAATFPAVNQGIPDIGRAEPDKLLPGGGRLIKTHEPYQQVYRRGIYLVRDVRDVIVSEYFYQLKVGAFGGTMQDFIHRFLTGRVNAYGSWQKHVGSWLEAPIAPNELCVARYEDLKAATVETIARIGLFLNLRWDDELIKSVIDNNSVRRMREKEQAGGSSVRGRSDIPFVRKGTSGNWPEALKPNHVGRIEATCGELLARLGYELTESSQATPAVTMTPPTGLE